MEYIYVHLFLPNWSVSVVVKVLSGNMKHAQFFVHCLPTLQPTQWGFVCGDKLFYNVNRKTT